MASISYALYAKAVCGEQAGEYVMCWNFAEIELVIAVAKQRVYDVGTIFLYRHIETDGTFMRTVLQVFEK